MANPARRYRVVLFVLLAAQWLSAGNDIQPEGAKSAAMGNCSVMMGGLWSAFNNQAGLVGLEGLSAGAYYHNVFFVDGLSDQGLVIAYGQEQRAFALDLSTFGQDNFSQNRLGLAYSMQLSEILDMGVQVNYHATRIGGIEEQSGNSLTAEIGLLAHLTEDLDIGFHLFNPTQTQLSEFEDERLATIMNLGASYALNDKARLVAEVAKDVDAKAVVRAGIEYQVVSKVFLRGGLSSEPTLNSFGAGVQLNRFDIDFAASYHQALGYSTQISLAYRFKQDAL